MTSTALACDVTPQFTDWGNVPEFKKLVWAANPPTSGLTYLDYGAYIPDGGDPNTTPALGMNTSTGNEPCYKFFLGTVNNDTSFYATPNPDARGLRSDCRFGPAVVNGQVMNGDSNGNLFTLDTFPFDQCTLDINATGCPVDGTTSDGTTCLQKCKMGTEQDTKSNVIGDGTTVRFKLANNRMHGTSKGSEGTSYQTWKYNEPAEVTNLATGSVTGMFDGKLCTYLDMQGGGGSASVLNYTPDAKGRSPAYISGSTPLCSSGRIFMPNDSAFVSSAPTFLDVDNAMKCCQSSPSSYNDPQWQQVCQNTAFDTLSGSGGLTSGESGACNVLFQHYCMKNWGDPNKCPSGLLCNNFIHQPSSASAITDTVYNYFVSDFRSGPPGSYPNDSPYSNPQDYISYGMRGDMNSVSQQYYDHHKCTVRPSTCEKSGDPYQVPEPCCRDDALDPFFVSGIPQMCGAQPGACQKILPTICAQFTRDQLAGDDVLAAMCGCYLSNCTYDATNPTCSLTPNQVVMPSLNATPLKVVGVQADSQYPKTSEIDGPKCDPACRGAFVQNPSLGTNPCSNTCVMDNISVNAVNSSIGGGISFAQICGPDSSCYISDVAVTMINSNVVGDTTMTQNCGKGCYTLNPTTSAWDCVSCSDLKTPCPVDNGDDGNDGGDDGGDGTTTTPPTTTPPTTTPPNTTSPTIPSTPKTPSDDTSNPNKSGIGAWFKKHSTFLLMIALLIVALIVISYITGSSTSSGGDEIIGDVPDMGSDGYYAM